MPNAVEPPCASPTALEEAYALLAVAGIWLLLRFIRSLRD